MLKILDRIETNSITMSHLIGSLLDLAKIETGRALDAKPVELFNLIQQVIDNITPRLEQKHLTIELDCDKPSLQVQCDALQMRQVFENLLSNAVKYTKNNGHIKIKITTTTAEVMICIADNGIGIPQRDLPLLFDRFYRVNDEEHQTEEGTGLGLAIVKSIIEQHGGTIHVESAVGQGSTFTLTLPL